MDIILCQIHDKQEAYFLKFLVFLYNLKALVLDNFSKFSLTFFISFLIANKNYVEIFNLGFSSTIFEQALHCKFMALPP